MIQKWAVKEMKRSKTSRLQGGGEVQVMNTSLLGHVLETHGHRKRIGCVRDMRKKERHIERRQMRKVSIDKEIFSWSTVA